jgi:hypothetical protein
MPPVTKPIAKPATVQPVKPVQSAKVPLSAPSTLENGRPVKNPKITVELRIGDDPELRVAADFLEKNGMASAALAVKRLCGSPLTEKEVEEILGWETEEDFTKRKKAENPDAKEKDCSYGEDYLIKDLLGNKIRCRNNVDNRPFTEAHALALAQSFLTREWAGTGKKPGETINGEPLIIGRTDKGISLQHRLIGFKLACQKYRGKHAARWKAIWEDKPLTFPTIIVRGVDESPDTVRTIDNTRPRSPTDVVYTSDIFKDLMPLKRKECARMLDVASDVLWKRTKYGAGNVSAEYQTNTSIMEFIKNHSKLEMCVKHIMQCNDDRSLSVQKLSPGYCAAMMYLMAVSSTDPDEYLENGRKHLSPRNEKDLDFANYDKARTFWTLLSKTKVDPTLAQVWEARRPHNGDESVETYGGFVFPKGDEVSTDSERVGVIAKAWELYANDFEVVAEELSLPYDVETLDDGSVESFTLKGPSMTFGGIDYGDPRVGKKAENASEKTEAPPDEEEIELAKPERPPVNETPAQERARREATLAKGKETKEEKFARMAEKRKTDEAKAAPATDEENEPDDIDTSAEETEAPEEEAELLEEQPEEVAPPPKKKVIVRKP